MYPFIYWGSILDEIDNEIRKVSGCTFADDFTEAMSNIEDYYGTELIDVHMESLDECSVVEFANPKEGKHIVKREC